MYMYVSTLWENQKPQRVKKRKGRTTFVPTSRTNMWQAHETWKPPKVSGFNLLRSKYNNVTTGVTINRLESVFLQLSCTLTLLGATSSELSMAVLSARPGVGYPVVMSGRRRDPWMEAFYLQTTRELRRKNVRWGHKQPDFSLSASTICPPTSLLSPHRPKHPLSLWLNKHSSCVHSWTHKGKHTSRDVQVAQKQNQHCQ